MEAAHSLPNGSSRWENVQLVGSIYEAYPCHVQVDLGKYVSVGLQYFLQSGPFLFANKGTNVGAFVRAIYEHGLQGIYSQLFPVFLSGPGSKS